MRTIDACVGTGALAIAILGAMGCAAPARQGAPAASGAATAAVPSSPSSALAFEIPASAADACAVAGTPRVLASDVDGAAPIAVAAHDGWLAVSYTSVSRGRVAIDLETTSLHVLGSHTRAAPAPMRTAAADGARSASALDTHGNGVFTFVVATANGVELTAVPIACAPNARL